MNVHFFFLLNKEVRGLNFKISYVIDYHLFLIFSGTLLKQQPWLKSLKLKLGDFELKAATRDNEIYLEKLKFVFILQLLDIIIFRLYVVIDHLTLCF